MVPACLFPVRHRARRNNVLHRQIAKVPILHLLKKEGNSALRSSIIRICDITQKIATIQRQQASSISSVHTGIRPA